MFIYLLNFFVQCVPWKNKTLVIWLIYISSPRGTYILWRVVKESLRIVYINIMGNNCCLVWQYPWSWTLCVFTLDCGCLDKPVDHLFKHIFFFKMSKSLTSIDDPKITRHDYWHWKGASLLLHISSTHFPISFYNSSFSCPLVFFQNSFIYWNAALKVYIFYFVYKQ